MRDTHVASSVVDVLRVATDGGARELLRVVLDEAPGATGGSAIVFTPVTSRRRWNLRGPGGSSVEQSTALTGHCLNLGKH